MYRSIHHGCPDGQRPSRRRAAAGGSATQGGKSDSSVDQSASRVVPAGALEARYPAGWVELVHCWVLPRRTRLDSVYLRADMQSGAEGRWEAGRILQSQGCHRVGNRADPWGFVAAVEGSLDSRASVLGVVQPWVGQWAGAAARGASVEARRDMDRAEACDPARPCSQTDRPPDPPSLPCGACLAAAAGFVREPVYCTHPQTHTTTYQA